MSSRGRKVNAFVSYSSTGDASISIKDKKLFPDGFFFTFDQGCHQAEKIRKALAPSGRSGREWQNEADDGYLTQMPELWRPFIDYPATEEERRNKMDFPPMFLGAGLGGEFLLHDSFAPGQLNPAGDKEPVLRVSRSLLVCSGYKDEGLLRAAFVLEFLRSQMKHAQTPLDAAVFGHSSLGSARSGFLIPGRTNDLLERRDVELLEDLHRTERHTVVFVHGLDEMHFGSNPVVGGALESLIRSNQNPFLSFVVSKLRLTDSEKHRYAKIIDADPADAPEGSMTLENVREGLSSIPFRAPAEKKVFGAF